MSTEQSPVIVIGAGGAGLLAAFNASTRGARVILLERNRKFGVKLLISGGGKCNVTHAGTVEEILEAFPLQQRRFLKPALYRYPAAAVQEYLAEEGVPTFARENGRVFPESGRAEDVVQTFVRALTRNHVETRLNARVSELQADDQGVSGVVVDGTTIATRSVLVATGGVSYSKTGTTGDGITWARNFGHTIVPLQPALAPIGVMPHLPTAWRGVPLRDGALAVCAEGRIVARSEGDLLFTHEGISGPAALDCSNGAARNLGATLLWDFLPTMDETEVDRLILDRLLRDRGKMIQAQFFDLIPNRIVPEILGSIGIPAETKGYVFTAAQRRAIVTMLKGWAMGTVKYVDIERGEVTAGGVALPDVDARTMESRKVPGLFFAGEILDIDGPIGGYNLQAAFSMGVLAGDHLAQRVA